MDKQDKIKRILGREPLRRESNGALVFIGGDVAPRKTAGKGPFAAAKNFCKRYGKVYGFLRGVFSPLCRCPQFKAALNGVLARHGEDAAVLNLGCGPAKFQGRDDIINVDIYAFDETDLVADVKDLPAADGTVDMLLGLSFLEHVDRPEEFAAEILRVLKPGGEAFLTCDFMYPFHAAPYDFQRLTREGLGVLFENFDEVETGVASGPTGSLMLMFKEWAATLLSFGSRTVYDVLYVLISVVTFPFKYLDVLLCRYPTAEIAASSYYVRVRKGK
jgi:SAM-dependent methyltransferase